MYLNARFYDPSTGRFITQDTYRGEREDASTWHLYVYCANNPVNFVDPSGHKIEQVKIPRSWVATGIDLLIGGAFGAILSKTAFKKLQKQFLRVRVSAKKEIVKSLEAKFNLNYGKVRKSAYNAWKKIVKRIYTGSLGSWKNMLSKKAQNKVNIMLTRTVPKKIFGKATGWVNGFIMELFNVQAIDSFLSVGNFVATAAEYQIDRNLSDGKIVIKL